MGDILHHLGALDDMKTSCKFIMEPFQVQEGNGILPEWIQETLLALVEHPGVGENFDFRLGRKSEAKRIFSGPFQGYPEYVGFSVDP